MLLGSELLALKGRAAKRDPNLGLLTLTSAKLTRLPARLTRCFCSPTPKRSTISKRTAYHGFYERRVKREVLLRAATRTFSRRRRSEPGECAAKHEQAEPQSRGRDSGMDTRVIH